MTFVKQKGEVVATGAPVENDFVYAAGNLVNDSGDSDFAYIKDRGLGGGVVIDDFERGNLDPYEGALSEFAITQSPVYEGQYALLYTGGSKHGIGSRGGDGLPAYPEPGSTFAASFYADDFANIDIGWGAPSGTNIESDGEPEECYYIYCAGPNRNSNVETNLNKNIGGDATLLASTPESVPQEYLGEWIQFFVDWGSDGTITVEVQEPDGDTIIGPITGEDSEYKAEYMWFYVDQDPSSYSGDPSTDTAAFDYARKVT